MNFVDGRKSLSGLGGKWTTYRSMAVDTVDAAIEKCGLTPKHPSGTDGLTLDGGYRWTPNHYIKLAQNYGCLAVFRFFSNGCEQILLFRFGGRRRQALVPHLRRSRRGSGENRKSDWQAMANCRKKIGGRFAVHRSRGSIRAYFNLKLIL